MTGEPGALSAVAASVRSRVSAAAGRAGRDPDAVTVVAACKGVAAAHLPEVLDAGFRDLGENRAQELLAKAPILAAAGSSPCWHFIGELQRNKVRALAPWVAVWHTVDRVSLAESLGRHAPGARVLVEVNLAREPQKAGCEPAAVPALTDALRAHDLDVVGLMTVPPASGDPRPHFAALRALAERWSLPELSMGMSQDFEVAIEEGATLVRIGRALFGPRAPGA